MARDKKGMIEVMAHAIHVHLGGASHICTRERRDHCQRQRRPVREDGWRVWRKMRKHYKFGLHVAEKTSRREKEKKAKKMVWEEG